MNSKLSPQQVEEVRQAYGRGDKASAIARRYSITRQQVWAICNGRSRRDRATVDTLTAAIHMRQVQRSERRLAKELAAREKYRLTTSMDAYVDSRARARVAGRKTAPIKATH